MLALRRRALDESGIMNAIVQLTRSSAGVIALSISLLMPSAATAAEGVNLSPNPPNCPTGYRCLLIQEYVDMTVLYLEVKGERDRLRWQQRTFGHFLKPFLTIGVEKLPNLDEYHPYGMAGLNIGRVSLWVGFFGEEPAYGIGWRISK